MSAELVGMSFSYKENQAFYVPVPQDREEAQKSSISSNLYSKMKIHKGRTEHKI